MILNISGIKKSSHQQTEDFATEIVAGVIKDEQGRIALLYHEIEGIWLLPGGKIEHTESTEEALKRELMEEIGIDVTSNKKIGNVKIIHQGQLYRIHCFECTYQGEPKNQESEKHASLHRAEIIPHNNEIGFIIKIENTLIEDTLDIKRNFVDIYHLQKNIFNIEGTGEGLFFTDEIIEDNRLYNIYFDTKEKKYRIIDNTKKIHSTYISIYQLRGKELIGLQYQITEKGYTKYCLIRHGQTFYNLKERCDCENLATLTEKGKQQAKKLGKQLEGMFAPDEKKIIICSPLQRTFDTIAPYAKNFFSESQRIEIEKKYGEISEKYNNIVKKKSRKKYINDTTTEKFFKLEKSFFVDFRIAELYLPGYQNNHFNENLLVFDNFPLGGIESNESLQDVSKRVEECILNAEKNYGDQTILIVSHRDVLSLIMKFFHDFDYNTNKEYFLPDNASCHTYFLAKKEEKI